MADEHSPESVGERAMFAPGATPVPLPQPNSPTPLPTSAGEPPAAPPGQDGTAALLAAARRLNSSRIAAFRRWRERAGSLSPSAIARLVGLAVETELDRGIAFILAPCFLAAGAAMYFSLGHEPGFPALAAGAGGLGIVARISRAHRLLHMGVLAALLCVAGALFAKIETWRASTRMLGAEVATQLSGTVAEIERLASGRVRLTIDVTGTERPVLRYAPDRVRVSAPRVPEGLAAGSVVTGLVRLLPPSGPIRPGGYDFSFESYFDGVGASGFFLRGPALVARSASPPASAKLYLGVERFREAVARRISRQIGGAEGEIAAALVVGIRAGIPEEVNEALRRAGIYHIISISGLHMALVAGTIMVLLRSGFALLPDFSSRHAVKKYAAALALLGLTGYLFISGAEVAAQRSYIMLAVMLAAVLFDRAALTLRNLAIAALIVTALSPHEVVGPSFQMSFAATAALVGAYAAWADWRETHPGPPPAKRSIPNRIGRYLALAVAGLAVTSIVAGGATAIYAAWHFQQMPSLGLFTNLAAMPVVSAVVMPAAVLGALAMPFGFDGPFFYVMGLGLTATITIARWFAERSPGDMVGLIPAAAVAAMTVALLIATVFSTWLRAAAVPVALLGLLLLLDRPRPGLFISEDGRLVGLDTGAGRIAVNRTRPSGFALDNWKRAMRASEVVRPEGRQERTEAAQLNRDGERTSTGVRLGEVALLDPDGRFAATQEESQPTPAKTPPDAGFTCAEGLCLARHASGAIVAHALDAEAALDACATASVIVVDDATAKNTCRWQDVLVVTKRELALNGSVAVTFPEGAENLSRSTGIVEYAIRTPFRPWHEHRRFSRAARGLAPYERKSGQAQPPGAPPASDPAAAARRQAADPADSEPGQ